MKKENNKVFEISIELDKEDFIQREIISCMLIESGVNPTIISEFEDKSSVIVRVYFNKKKDAEILVHKLKIAKLNKIKIKLKCILESSWRDKWKEDFKAFKLTETIRVVPVWDMETISLKKNFRDVYVDTSFAFGTGLHETTSFMAKLIEKYKTKFDTFLDVGTGTGLLCFVAKLNNAKIIDAFDFDNEAVKVAKSNAKINNCKFNKILACDVNDFKSDKSYDFVAANLITDVLISNFNKLVSFVGVDKYLAVSGISLENLARFKRSIKKYPLRCLKIEKGHEWCAILYKKISNN